MILTECFIPLIMKLIDHGRALSRSRLVLDMLYHEGDWSWMCFIKKRIGHGCVLEDLESCGTKNGLLYEKSCHWEGGGGGGGGMYSSLKMGF